MPHQQSVLLSVDQPKQKHSTTNISNINIKQHTNIMLHMLEPL